MNKALKSMIFIKFGTQDDFAAQIGVSRSVVSNVVQGRRKLSFQQRIKWAEALDSAVDDIFPADQPISETGSLNTQNNSDSPSKKKEGSVYEK